MTTLNATLLAQVKALMSLGITLDKIPASSAPAGQTSNLVDPVSSAYKITIINAVCCVIVFFFVGLRLFTRVHVVRSVGYDDYCTLFAFLCWLGEMSLFQYATRWGAGRHIWDISLEYLYPNLLRGWVICAVMYSVTMLFAKLSILLMYRRLFPIGNFMYRWWFVTIFTVGYSTGGALASLFQCRPMESTWTLVVPDYCIDTKKFYISNAALNVASDILVLALPIPVVWALNLKMRQKIVLSVIFAIGSFSCVISILRMTSIISLYRDGYTDLTWGLVKVVLWSQSELTAAIVCACIPCIRPFFERYTPFIFSFGGSGNYSSDGKYVRTGGDTRGDGMQSRRTAVSRCDEYGHPIELTKTPVKDDDLEFAVVHLDSDAESTEGILEQGRARQINNAMQTNDGITVQKTYEVR